MNCFLKVSGESKSIQNWVCYETKYFWTDCPKFKIDLHGHYVAQNLEKCVLILIQFLEYESKQNWAVKHAKNKTQESQE